MMMMMIVIMKKIVNKQKNLKKINNLMNLLHFSMIIIKIQNMFAIQI